MKLNKLIRRSSVVTVLVGATVLSTTGYASGSFSRPSGGLQDPYNYGKAIFHKKVICNSCPLQSEKIDRQSASNMVGRIGSDGKFVPGLNKRERMAVVHYLEKRYKLN